MRISHYNFRLRLACVRSCVVAAGVHPPVHLRRRFASPPPAFIYIWRGRDAIAIANIHSSMHVRYVRRKAQDIASTQKDHTQRSHMHALTQIFASFAHSKAGECLLYAKLLYHHFTLKLYDILMHIFYHLPGIIFVFYEINM